MKRIKALGLEVVVYEPMPTEDRFLNSEVVHDLPALKARSNQIVEKRRTGVLTDKVVTRHFAVGDRSHKKPTA